MLVPLLCRDDVLMRVDASEKRRQTEVFSCCAMKIAGFLRYISYVNICRYVCVCVCRFYAWHYTIYCVFVCTAEAREEERRPLTV